MPHLHRAGARAAPTAAPGGRRRGVDEAPHRRVGHGPVGGDGEARLHHGRGDARRPLAREEPEVAPVARRQGVDGAREEVVEARARAQRRDGRARPDAPPDVPAMDAAPDVAADVAPPDARDVPAEPMETAVDATWSTSAMALACTPGVRHTYRCPPRGTPAPCWGTDLYTHDSSVCTAAVHRGRITADDGGTVTFEMRAGAAGYIGSLRNGVTSLSTGSWPCSVAFP